jgi:hypothetical protein
MAMGQMERERGVQGGPREVGAGQIVAKGEGWC